MKRNVFMAFLFGFAVIMSLNIFHLDSEAQLQSSSVSWSLIGQYEEAEQRNDSVMMEDLRVKILANQTLVNYLKVNRPFLYEKVKAEPKAADSILVEDEKVFLPDKEFLEAQLINDIKFDSELDDFDVNDQADEFPSSDRRSNREIAMSEPNDTRTTNRDIAMQFPNQNRANNRELIAQKQAQLKDDVSDLFNDFESNDVLLSISGINAEERLAILSILENDFQNVENIEELRYSNGVSYIKLRVNSNLDDFVNRLKIKDFGAFRLELVRFLSNRIDFTLVN